jgi:metal-responsive CopG/Arc/MetJ family transcriptional regulator
MQEPITVYLDSEIKTELDDTSRREGISTSDLVGRAVRNDLFSRKFRSLRERLAANAQSQGIITDQDVFDRVS